MYREQAPDTGPSPISRVTLHPASRPCQNDAAPQAPHLTRIPAGPYTFCGEMAELVDGARLEIV